MTLIIFTSTVQRQHIHRHHYHVQALPDGFIAEHVADEQAVSGTFINHPTTKKPVLLLAGKSGEISVLDDPDTSSNARLILNLRDRICHNGERGVQNIVPHPNFDDNAENRWIYIFYTDLSVGCKEDAGDDTPQNVVVRFKMDPSTLELDYQTRQEIWRNAHSIKRNHNGGGMAFGNDGMLYLATGDTGDQSVVEPLDNLHGCVLRLTDIGDVPDDNPYTVRNGYNNSYKCSGTNGRVPTDAPDGSICSEIFASGFRNPFRLTMNPHVTDKVLFTVQDVGSNRYEEVNYGGTDYAGETYGWPDYEGPCRKDSLTDCILQPDLVDDDGNIKPKQVEPFYYYSHRSNENGGCVTGLAFVPKNLWPSEYNILLIDFVFSEIYSLKDDPDRECRSCDRPLPGYVNTTFYESQPEPNQDVNHAKPTDLFFGPYKDTQALYVMKLGNFNTVTRIRYTGSTNHPPVPVFTVKDLNHPVGTEVKFDGSLSSDPDDDTLAFEWNFGDGGERSTLINPTHTYTVPGDYHVTLTVTDSQGQAQEVSEWLKIGAPPIAAILTPTSDQFFFVGETLFLSGEAYDDSGDRIPDKQLEWEVRQHHADHFHPFLTPTNGNNFNLYPAPQPEDIWAATNSFLKVILKATDNYGLTTTIERDVMPRAIGVEVDSIPKGIDFFIDDFKVETPQRIVSWVGYDLPVKVENQTKYKFVSWSDGSPAMERKIRLVQTFPELILLATFCLLDDMECVDSQSFIESSGSCCSGICWEGVCRTEYPPHTPSTHPTTDATTYVATLLPSSLPLVDTPTATFASVPTLFPTPTAFPTDEPSPPPETAPFAVPTMPRLPTRPPETVSPTIFTRVPQAELAPTMEPTIKSVILGDPPQSPVVEADGIFNPPYVEEAGVYDPPKQTKPPLQIPPSREIAVPNSAAVASLILPAASTIFWNSHIFPHTAITIILFLGIV